MVPGEVQAPRAADDRTESAINDILQASGDISPEALLELSKGCLRNYLTRPYAQSGTLVQDVQILWDRLLETMRNASAADRHIHPACNAVSLFLRCANSSPIPSVKHFIMIPEVWLASFDVLLDKFDSGKLKPLRQVLNALIKVLEQHEDRVRARRIQDNVLSRMASIIYLGAPQSCLKASMVIFDAFMRSGIPSPRLLSAVGRAHGMHLDRCRRRLARYGKEAIDVQVQTEKPQTDESVYFFCFSLIVAVADSNAQATAGTLLTSFLSLITGSVTGVDLLWVEPVMAILACQPEAIEAFKNYLLPCLCSLNPALYHTLLQRVSSTHQDAAMLENALTIILLGVETGVLLEKDSCTPEKVYGSPFDYTVPRLNAEEASIHIETAMPDLRHGAAGAKLLQNTALAGDRACEWYAGLLTHPAVGVRKRVYQLLADPTATMRPIQSHLLSLLSAYLACLHGESDPGHRREVDWITKALIDRLRRGSVFYAKSLPGLDIEGWYHWAYKRELERHESFVGWFINFLEDELGPNCSFPRHISALRALQLLADSGIDPTLLNKFTQDPGHKSAPWPFVKSLHSLGLKFVLWHLLLDPYEEVRETSATLSKLLFQRNQVSDWGESINGPQRQDTELDLANRGSSKVAMDAQSQADRDVEVAELFAEAHRLTALTNRADHADGVGRLLWLQYGLAQNQALLVSDVLERLETAFSTRETSFQSRDCTLHGFLKGLKYIVEVCGFHEAPSFVLILDGTAITVHRLLSLCRSVWQAVRIDLCVDSPELSHETDPTDSLEGPKDFLSYSWRALRDSSLLMQAIIPHITSRPSVPLSEKCRIQHLRRVYSLCFAQLTLLRHRGAFSSVAQTFALCCERFDDLPGFEVEFGGWCQETFHILDVQSTKLTRRSAGLPALMAGILGPSSSDGFHGAMEMLISLASSGTGLWQSTEHDQQTRFPQVHALNCLREIFTNSRFRHRTVSWLIKVLDLAASSLRSKTWAIRNCGLMLFQACASRIGNASSLEDLDKETSALENQTCAILSIACKLLDAMNESDFDSSELLFAGLDLLSRIAIPKSRRRYTREKILVQLGSPVWMIREHAARIYAAQWLDTEVLETIVSLISSLSFREQNRCHGILLCCHELLKKHRVALLSFPHSAFSDLDQILHRYSPKIWQYCAPAVQSAFLDIIGNAIVLQHGTKPHHQLLLSKESVILLEELPRLDSSRPEVDIEGPCQSQLRCAKAFNACVQVLTLAGPTASTLHKIFEMVVFGDLDAAAALLHDLRDRISLGEHASLPLIGFFMAVVSHRYAEDITTAAMLGFVEGIESLPECVDASTPTLGLEHLMKELVVSAHSGGREFSNARIRALGSILAYRSKTMLSTWNNGTSAAVGLWTALLSSAAGDATEALTRMNAAKSLHCFRHCLVEDCDRAGARKKATLYSVLFDFLNDDDEEIRDLAASTASFVLSTRAAETDLVLCPLAACHQLSNYMADTFSCNGEFHVIAVSRIMFPPSAWDNDPDAFAGLVSYHSVSQQLKIARRISYDLFEEERQNLYRDEVREINIWHSAIGRVPRTCLDDELVMLVGQWAIIGHRVLSAALPSLSNGPYGVLSRLEMVALFMRVIRMTGLCLEWTKGGDWSAEPAQKPPLLVGMERLLATTREYPIHPRVQRALEATTREGLSRLRPVTTQIDRASEG